MNELIRIGDFKPEQKHIDAVVEVIKSGRLTEDKKVKELERVMEKYLDVKHAIMVTNGTVALQLVSQYLGEGLTVCVPAMTFPATANAFTITGQNVVLCDVGEDLQIDIDNLSDKEKQNIDVIVPVHLMGYTANMNKIMKQAKEYNWIVVEDTCEAFGATYKDKKVGTIGNFGCYSFYVSHNILAGELGMVTTDDDNTAKVIRAMKNHGRTGDSMQFNHDYVGSNYKTTEFNVAIALVNMKNVDIILESRKNNFKYITERIKQDKFKPFPYTSEFSPLGIPIICENKVDRNNICTYLNKHGIETRYMFPCLANQGAYKNIFNYNYPIAEQLENIVFYIGCHQHLTLEDMNKMIYYINTYEVKQ